MKKAVCFDCWNTCFYNEIPPPNPYTEFSRRIGKNPLDPSYLRSFKETFMLEKRDMGDSIRIFLDKMGVQYDDTRIKELRQILMKFTKNVEAYPETLDVLKRLRKNGIKSGLVTNCYSQSFEALIQRFPVDGHFDAIVISYDVKALKPDYKIFEVGLEKLGVKPEKALMVGDNLEEDVRGAENAGIQGILIDREGKHRSLDKIEIINSLWEIQKYLSLTF